jgi:hypothetical protein
MKINLNFQAIYVGVLADFGLTFFFSSILKLFYDYLLFFKGTQVSTVTCCTSFTFLYAIIFLNLFFNFCGGFLAAKYAGEKLLLHSSVASIPALILSALYYFNPVDPANSILPFLLCVPSYLLGGYQASIVNPPSEYK